MRTVFAAVFLLSVSAAMAAEMPIVGAYGSDAACAMVAKEPDLLIHSGPPLDGILTDEEDMAFGDQIRILVFPDRTVNVESGCTFSDVQPIARRGWSVKSTCASTNDSWTSNFEFTAKGRTAVIKFNDGDQFTLKLCDD